VVVLELFFHAIYGFDQVLLVAEREGHAHDGSLYGNQRLMYCGLLHPIHGNNLNPFAESRKPRDIERAREEGPTNNEPRLFGAGLVSSKVS